MTTPAGVPRPFDPGEYPPKAVAWLHPGQLLRTAYHVWMSTIAKDYLDRRETLAALDPDDLISAIRPSRTNPSLDKRAQFDAEVPADAQQHDIWIDFVADIGDSWNATYAVANLAARPTLDLRGYAGRVKSADVLVLGGDLIYPTPTRDGYRRRMRSPLIAARPANQNGHAPCLLAIPGNHDWYDGLTNFVREFCQGQTLGGWRMVQRRSYFAVKLGHGWWLWGIDIALDTRIDAPQQAYFLRILDGDEFNVGDNIILCTAKPAWLDKDTRSAGYKNLSYFVREIIENAGKGCVRIILSGDLHHYSRYENAGGDQLVTAGGGGAYLTATHHLPLRVPDLSSRRDDGHADAPCHVKGFPYPSRTDSRRLTLGALLLAFRPANLPFTLFVGALYWMFVKVLQIADPDLLNQSLRTLPRFLIRIALSPSLTVGYGIVIATIAACAVVAASSNSESSRARTVPWGVFHAFLHLTLAVVVACLLHRYFEPRVLADWLEPGGRAYRITLGLTQWVVSGFAGGTLVGIYFVLSDFLFAWHGNEAFAAQSIINYRNFVRMRVKPDGTVTLFPIGLRHVPRKWRFNLKREPHEPYYEPADRVLTPHLIEGPIEVSPREKPRILG